MRKNLYIFMSILCCVVLLLPLVTNAHPGRTDSNGGHTCRTNCEKWGLEYGEYHYHNGGNSSSNSSSGSKSNATSGSSSNNVKQTTSKSVSKPQPKIDKKQIQADEHYNNAIEFFNNEKFHNTLEELDKIYELDRNDSKTEELIKNSLTAIYSLAESSVNDENYEKSKELLDFILTYQHSNNKIKEKADELLKDVILIEKIENLLSNAEEAKVEKKYEEAISYIEEASKLKDTEKVSKVFDTVISDIVTEAEVSYLNNEFEKANNLYVILEKYSKSSELKNDYQIIIHQIQNLQLIQENYGLETIDVSGKSLFNQLIEKEEKHYSIEIINKILHN